MIRLRRAQPGPAGCEGFTRGEPGTVAQRVLERMDAMLAEKDHSGRPVAYGRVAGVVVTHLGPGPGPNYLDDERGHEWSAKAARTMEGNLFAAAKALRENPLPVPSES